MATLTIDKPSGAPWHSPVTLSCSTHGALAASPSVRETLVTAHAHLDRDHGGTGAHTIQLTVTN